MTPEDDHHNGASRDQDDEDNLPTVEASMRSAATEELLSDVIPRPVARSSGGAHGFAPGDVFNAQYRVAEMVGHGGFCEVYRAQDLATEATVALKFLRDTDTTKSVFPRLQRELRLARDLGHPNIVKVNDLIESEGRVCLVMDFVEGMTLKKLIVDEGKLPVDRALTIMKELTSAVAAVHAGDIVHRDLKPQNVMITHDGEVKLLDFGLARTTDSTGLTATGTILGTPDYMSPEQVNGVAADSRSDVYSLGIIAWELFVGQPPFSGDTPIAVALQHVRSRAPEISTQRDDVPPEVSTLVSRMTDPDPKNRPKSAEAVLLELERSAGSGLGLFPGPTSTTRRTWRLVAAGLVFLIAGAATGFKLMRPATPANPFADGKVVTSVQARAPILRAAMESELFLQGVADTIPKLWDDPRITSKNTDENLLSDPTAAEALGIEQLLEVSFEEDPDEASTSARLRLRVFNTSDGSVWWESEIASNFTMDFPGIVAISQDLAGQYASRVDAAIRSSIRDAAAGS